MIPDTLSCFLGITGMAPLFDAEWLFLMYRPPSIRLAKIEADLSLQTQDIAQTYTGFKGRINRVHFVDLNKTLLSAGEDGFVRRWDVEVSSISI